LFQGERNNGRKGKKGEWGKKVEKRRVVAYFPLTFLTIPRLKKEKLVRKKRGGKGRRIAENS